MQITVEILLVIGIFVNFVKGAELILRPHQQKWLQEKSDWLALYLDYTRPIKWYNNEITKKKTFSIIYLVIILTLMVSALFSEIAPLYIKLLVIAFLLLLIFTVFLEGLSFFDRTYKPATPVSDIFTSPKRERMLHRLEMERRLFTWVINGTDFINHLLKMFLLVISTSLLIVAIYFSFNILFNLSDTYRHFVTIGMVIFVILIYEFQFAKNCGYYLFIFIFAGITSFIALIVCFFLIIAEFMLAVIRAIVWRIAEYNKGAFAALILIITAILGVTEFYWRLKYPPPSVPSHNYQQLYPTNDFGKPN
ncbi:MAG: hypothetical protein WA584_17605 [Pyrinomonadaceae bacterium]